MPSYLPSFISENCQCAHNLMKAVACFTGHLAECHFPLDCRAAGCGHLDDYGIPPEEVQELRDAADRLFRSAADSRCTHCTGRGFRSYVITFPTGDQGVLDGICQCVDLAEVAKVAEEVKEV